MLEDEKSEQQAEEKVEEQAEENLANEEVQTAPVEEKNAQVVKQEDKEVEETVVNEEVQTNPEEKDSEKQEIEKPVEERKEESKEKTKQRKEETKETRQEAVISDEIKKEASQTVNQVKETIKKIDVKKDTKEAKGFFLNFIKNPVEEIKKVASDSKNEYLKFAIIILVIWLACNLLTGIVGLFRNFGYSAIYNYYYFGNNILGLIKVLIAPVLTVLALSCIIYFLNKKEKKTFLTIACTVVITKLPVILVALIGILQIISSDISKIISPISTLCSVISYVLLYISVKKLFQEEDEKNALFKFITIFAIYTLIAFVFSFLGIYL